MVLTKKHSKITSRIFEKLSVMMKSQQMTKTSLFKGWGNDLSFSEENKAIIDIYQN